MTRCFFLWATAISWLAAVAGAQSVPADAPPTLASSGTRLLERAGDRVRQFWDELALVTCTETLLQEKFNEKGKKVLSNQSRYDYFIFLTWDGGELVMDESRVEIDPPRKRRPQGSLLATQGFATLLLVLHPEFQTSYSFEVGSEDPATGWVPIFFLPRTDGRSPGALELGGRTYPIAWTGTAWVEPDSASITQVEASWYQPPTQVGLEALTASVKYTPVEVAPGKAFWLPETARIDLATPHQAWRNSHRFGAYHLFSVETEINISSAPATSPEAGPAAEDLSDHAAPERPGGTPQGDR